MMDEIEQKDVQRRKAAAFLQLVVIEKQYMLLLEQLLIDVMEDKVQAEEAAERLLVIRQAHTVPQQEATNELFKFLYHWAGAAALDITMDRWRSRLQVRIRNKANKEPDDGV